MRAYANLVLTGFMGVGKTTIGRMCAQRLNYEFVDTDALLEMRSNASISQLFAEKGETEFRKMESHIVAEVAAREKHVVSCGGGVPLLQANRQALRETGLVILLTAPVETLLERIGSATHRPLLQAPEETRQERIQSLLEAREAAYKAIAHCKIDTSRYTMPQVVEHIITLYRTVTGMP